MTSDRPKHWSTWLSMAEWWYNTTYDTAIKMTPFEALYGHPPPQLCIPQDKYPAEPDVQKFIQDRRATLQLIRARLLEAHSIMKFFADKHRSEREFNPGDWVFLRLQPYRQTSLSMRRDFKPAPKFYKPYRVIELVGRLLINWGFLLQLEFILSSTFPCSNGNSEINN